MNAGGTGGEPGAPRPLSGYLWLWYLFFRPKLFFPHFAVDHAPLMTVFAAWLSGIADATGNLDARAALHPDRYKYIQTWLHYWGFCAATGAFGGLVYFAIGGWWFRVRLNWCGLKDIDMPLARRVYLYGSLTAAFPALVLAIRASTLHPTPWAYWSADYDLWEALVFVFWFWSIWTVYAGARVVFAVRGFKGVLWFLVVPSALMGAFCVGIGAFTLVGLFGPPDTTHTLVHEAGALRVEYPGNWTAEPDEDPDDGVDEVFIGDGTDSLCAIHLLRSDDISDEALERFLEPFRLQFQDIERTGRFERWGRFAGVGATYRLKLEHLDCEMRLFIGDAGGGVQVRTSELVAVDDIGHDQPGFDLIRRTLTVSPDDAPRP